MKREFLMIVIFLAVALVTTEIFFTPPAQGRWVLLEALVNPNNDPLEFYGGEGGTPRSSMYC